jgi:hypothetical protein
MIDMSHSSASVGRPAGNRFAPTARLLLIVLSAVAAFSTPAWSQEAAGTLPRDARGQAGCQAGEEACPAVLRMKPGSVVVEASGSVSGKHPNYYFKFDARAGQKATIGVTGGGIKTGPGIPITFPNGGSDALDVGQPFTLPETGTYVIVMHANTMSDGPFGRFHLTLRID